MVTFKHYFICACGLLLSVITGATVVCTCRREHRYVTSRIRIEAKPLQPHFVVTMSISGGPQEIVRPMNKRVIEEK